MKSYVYIIYIFILSFLFLRLLEYIGLPFWATYLVGFPVLFYVLIYLTIRFSFRDSVDFKSIPTDGYDTRLASLKKNDYRLYSLGFKKFDEFYLPIANDVVAFVYYHEELPIIVCDYHLGQEKYYEMVSRFSNGFTLTTSNSEGSGLIPRDVNKMLQIFPEQSLKDLHTEHKLTLEFLSSRNFKISPLQINYFRKWFINEYKKTGKSLKNPLSPIKLFIWKVTNHKKKYIKALQEQFLAKTQQIP